MPRMMKPSSLGARKNVAALAQGVMRAGLLDRQPGTKHRTAVEKAAARHAMMLGVVEASRCLPFQHRGLSNRTIEALLSHGVDAPERLLFMSMNEIRAIRGIGKAAVAEITNYRERFVSRAHQ